MSYLTPKALNSSIGMPGMTAYARFYEVCSPKKGEYVVRTQDINGHISVD